MSKILVLSLTWPSIMLVVGYMLIKSPVWDIAAGGGYATKASCVSQERWDYAQITAPPILMRNGAIIFALVFGLALFEAFYPNDWLIHLGGIFSFVASAATYYYIEHLIKTKA